MGSSRYSRYFSMAAAGLLLAALFVLPQTAIAQEGGQIAKPPAAASPSAAPGAAAPLATAPSSDDLKTLLTTLQDPSARQKLIGQIQTLIELRQKAGEQTTGAVAGGPAPQAATITASDADGAPGVQAIQATSGQIRRISDVLVSGAAALLNIPRLMHWIEGQLGNQTTRLVWLYVALKIAGVLAAAFAAEQLTRFLLRGARRASADRVSAAQWVRLL